MFLFTLLLMQAAVAIDASQLTLDTPTTVAVVDTDKIKGEPWRLAWSPDNEQLYLQAMKRNRDGSMELTHHVVAIKSGAVEKVDVEPEWAKTYWTWKSDRAAPKNPAFSIELDQQIKTENATSRPMGGDLARGGTTGGVGASVEEASGHMGTNVRIITLLLKGEVIGQWKGEPFVPGLTYGWAPAGMNAMAFAAQDGRLTVLDEQGRKQKIPSSKDARLPAWTADGRRLAWAEKQDKKKFRIQVASIG